MGFEFEGPEMGRVIDIYCCVGSVGKPGKRRSYGVVEGLTSDNFERFRGATIPFRTPKRD
jgi:hypothetical protein